MLASYMVEWHAQKKTMTREAFAAKYNYPFLIRQADPEQIERISFQTQVASAKDAADAERSALWAGGAIVVPVIKKPENPYPERISIGRAQNCDVVIRDGTVSKLHGHFSSVGPGEAQLVDRGSHNGTTLNGTPVTKEPVRVVSGDKIVFGDVAVQFVDARRLWDLL
jgi:FHA domain